MTVEFVSLMDFNRNFNSCLYDNMFFSHVASKGKSLY